MNKNQDEEEPVTDINVEIDASALAAGVVARRENVVTVPAPPLPAEAEQNTVKQKLIVRPRRAPPAEALPAEDDEASTGELLITRAPAEEEESTALNIDSRIRKALAPLESEPPLEETKPRPTSSPLLPKSERGFAMDLPATVPSDFFPVALPAGPDAAPLTPRGPKGTMKMVSTPDGLVVVDAPTEREDVVRPVARPVVPPVVQPLAQPLTPAAVAAPIPRAKAQPATVLVRSRPQGARWGRRLVLVLFAALLVAGYVEREAVTAFVLRTTAELRR